MWQYNHTDELYHYGRKGMQWGKNIFGDKKKPSKFTAPNVRNATKTYDGATETTAGYGQKSTKTYTFNGPNKVKVDKNPGDWDMNDVSKTMGKQKPEGHHTFDSPDKVKADKNPGGWKMKDVKKTSKEVEETSVSKDDPNLSDKIKKQLDKQPKTEQPKNQEAPKQERPKKESELEVEQPKNSVDMKTMANVSSNVGRNLSAIGQAVNQIPTDRPKMDLSQMTNREMQERINRENLERQYNQLFSEPTRAEIGKQKVSKILSGVGTALTVAGSALAIAVSIQQLRKKD